MGKGGAYCLERVGMNAKAKWAHIFSKTTQTVLGSKSFSQRSEDIPILMRQTSKNDLRECPVAIFMGWGRQLHTRILRIVEDNGLAIQTPAPT